MLRIRYLGEPVLRARAEPVAEITDEIRRLAQDMVDTMLDEPGLGLAAPQVGESLRMVVVRIVSENQDEEDTEEEKPTVAVLVNPEVIESSEETITRREGCLSLPTLWGEVTRPKSVAVRAVDLMGRPMEMHGEGLMARVLLHEIDHLDGTVFLDKANPDTLVWLVPDEDQEEGYREDPTTVEEVTARFEHIARRRRAKEAEL